jgi:hypothetical protein
MTIFLFLLCIYSIFSVPNVWKSVVVQRLGLPAPEELKIYTKDGGVV